MILPNKHLSQERALLTVGAKLLALLSQPKTVSALWVETAHPIANSEGKQRTMRYDSFVLTLDLLFLMGAIELKDGIVSRKTP